MPMACIKPLVMEKIKAKID